VLKLELHFCRHIFSAHFSHSHNPNSETNLNSALVKNDTSPCFRLTSMIFQLVTVTVRYNHIFNAKFSLSLLQSTDYRPNVCFVYSQRQSADFSVQHMLCRYFWLV